MVLSKIPRAYGIVNADGTVLNRFFCSIERIAVGTYDVTLDSGVDVTECLFDIQSLSGIREIEVQQISDTLKRFIFSEPTPSGALIFPDHTLLDTLGHKIFLPSPIKGILNSMCVVIDGNITGTDAIIKLINEGIDVGNGSITIPKGGGTGAGDIFLTILTAPNAVNSGDLLEVEVTQANVQPTTGIVTLNVTSIPEPADTDFTFQLNQFGFGLTV